jgi:hypothetical protein
MHPHKMMGDDCMKVTAVACLPLPQMLQLLLLLLATRVSA